MPKNKKKIEYVNIMKPTNTNTKKVQIVNDIFNTLLIANDIVEEKELVMKLFIEKHHKPEYIRKVLADLMKEDWIIPVKSSFDKRKTFLVLASNYDILVKKYGYDEKQLEKYKSKIIVKQKVKEEVDELIDDEDIDEWE